MANFVQDQLSKAEAAIQAEVGKFLQYKAQILPYTKSNNSATANRAQVLMGNQVRLELELQKNLAMIEELKKIGAAGLLGYTNKIKGLYGFAKEMKAHKTAVYSLQGKPIPQESAPWGKIALAAVAVGAIAFSFKGRR